MEAFVVWLIRGIGFYVIAGFLFGLYFINRGAGKIDPSARQTGISFKLLILPGVIALWPILANRLLKHQVHPPEECNAHRQAAGGS